MMQIPVTIVGGYLGAGKTTLVNTLLRNSGGRHIAVLVNDFGDINIDADLIEAAEEDIVRLTGGCACCRIGNDLASALAHVTAAQNYHHVLVEASGVAQPARMAQAVTFVRSARLSGVVVVCDATVICKRLSDCYVGDLVKQQVVEAGLLILNKSDLVSAADLQICKDELASLNPNARLAEASFGDLEWELVHRSDTPTGHRSPVVAKNFHSVVLRGNQSIQAGALQAQISLSGPTRVKGFVTVDAAEPMLVELAGNTWVWPCDEQTILSHELVVIYQTPYNQPTSE